MNKFEIKDAGQKGKGGYATDKISKGELIIEFKGENVTKDEINHRISSGVENVDDPLQIDDDVFIDLNNSAYYFNHSCEPNSAIKGRNNLIAIRDIQEGEEITYDYSATVGADVNDWSMECKCGSPNCRHEIGNVTTIPKAQLDKYLAAGGIQDFIRRQLKIAEA
jgi:SET domain-containing protein